MGNVGKVKEYMEFTAVELNKTSTDKSCPTEKEKILEVLTKEQFQVTKITDSETRLEFIDYEDGNEEKKKLFKNKIEFTVSPDGTSISAQCFK